jgi:hypothetical protein
MQLEGRGEEGTEMLPGILTANLFSSHDGDVGGVLVVVFPRILS